jgi:hypothetical protein
MTGIEDLKGLMAGGKLDRAAIERLSRHDPEQIREMLSQYLPDAQVETILERIDSLVKTLEEGPSNPRR